MVEEEISRQFDAVEDKIEKLIEVCKSLKETNVELEDRIKGLEQEIRDKREAEKRHIGQRELVRQKIDNLMKKISEITEAESG